VESDSFMSSLQGKLENVFGIPCIGLRLKMSAVVFDELIIREDERCAVLAKDLSYARDFTGGKSSVSEKSQLIHDFFSLNLNGKRSQNG